MNKIKILFLVGIISTIFCAENPEYVEDKSADIKTLVDKQNNNGEVVSLTNTALKEYLKKSDDALLIIKFYAPWCGPCNRMEKGFQELSEEFSDVLFTSVNIDTEDAITEQYDISSVPTIIFIKNGEEIKRIIGYKSKPTLRKIVKKVLNRATQ